MKHLILIVILALYASNGHTQTRVEQFTKGTGEVVCGFTPRLHYYREANEVKEGLSVDFLIDEAQVNRHVTLRFFAAQRPTSFPVGDLELEGGKLMHVIGVRDDLADFFHINPTKTSHGVWEVTHTFSHGGVYRIWTDVKWRGASYSFGHKIFSVSGNLGPLSSAQELLDCVTNSGYAVTLKCPLPLMTQRTNQLEFSIRDQAGNLVATEDFHGASMQLFVIKDDLSVYLHELPGTALGSPAAIRFRQVLRTKAESGSPLAGTTLTRFHPIFPKPGTYKLFVQFRPINTKLPADEAILVEFYANVLNASSSVREPPRLSSDRDKTPR